MTRNRGKLHWGGGRGQLRPPPQEGFAFVAALMVVLVVAILITGVLTIGVSAYQLSTSRQEYTQALYVAEGGINKLLSDWRGQGAADPPEQPFEGELANGSSEGRYSITWTGIDDKGQVTMTSVGTVNPGHQGTVYHLSRTVEAKLDTDGDWAWNHVYYSDTDVPDMSAPLYAIINGGGDLEIEGETGPPEDFVDTAHGPMGGDILPTPMWDLWHEWVRLDLAYDPVTKQQIPRPDRDGDGLPDARWPNQATAWQAYTTTAVDARSDRHMYWYGSTAATPLASSSHAVDSHARLDQNYFMPDWFGFDNPDAYLCATRTKRFTVTFADGDFVGNYFVHGDIVVKRHARVYGTLIATGDIRFQGVDNVQIVPEAADPEAPCEDRVYYPALIAGRDVLVRDQGTDPGNDQGSLRVSGVVWSGRSYTGQASDVDGCVVAPSVTLGGNFLVRYGMEVDGCDYTPGDHPLPWFREPDRREMEPVARSWRELGI